MKPSQKLIDYIEREIVPRYASFDGAHQIDHVRMVLAQSLALAVYYPVDVDMVYAIAAFHDTGLVSGREFHHIDSGKILSSDPFLLRHFSSEQLSIMREAVEDHRASSDHAPRSIYGRIVAEADRCLNPETVIRRTIQFGLAQSPEAAREWHFTRCREHLQRKYAEGGYLHLWIPESDNAAKQKALRALIQDEERLHKTFNRLFDELLQQSESH